MKFRVTFVKDGKENSYDTSAKNKHEVEISFNELFKHHFNREYEFRLLNIEKITASKAELESEKKEREQQKRHDRLYKEEEKERRRIENKALSYERNQQKKMWALQDFFGGKYSTHTSKQKQIVVRISDHKKNDSNDTRYNDLDTVLSFVINHKQNTETKLSYETEWDISSMTLAKAKTFIKAKIKNSLKK